MNLIAGASRLALALAFFSIVPQVTLAATPTTITLSSSSTSIIYGSPLTLTAFVSPAVTSGRVTFYDGVTVVGIAGVSNGTATLVTTELSSGNRSLYAYYGGNGLYSASRSVVLREEVRTLAGSGFNPLPLSPGGLGVTIADFNGDGKLDLAEPGCNYVCIFLANGDGTFSPRPSLPAGAKESGYVFIESGDFNGDGKADLAGAEVVGEQISIWLGNGDGTFSGPTYYPIQGNPGQPVLGDFNGDGILDIVTASSGIPAANNVLLGNGDGTFAAAVPFQPLIPFDTLLIGDFNNDGKADLAFSSVITGPMTGILQGNGDGTFVLRYINLSLALFSAADLNGDGNADLLGWDQQGFHVLLGHGDGTFAALPPFTIGYSFDPLFGGGPVVGDVNGDGVPDLIGLVGPSDPFVAIGNGDGTFQVPIIQGILENSPIAVCDLNGDGIIDFIGATTNNLTIFLGVPPVDLALRKTHAGDFTPGQTDATYTIVVDNLGPNATHAPVTVTEMLPTGLTFRSLGGDGWTCVSMAFCSRSDSLPAGASFPPITLTVSVAAGGPRTRTNVAMVFVAGEINPANNTAEDFTVIVYGQTIAFGPIPAQTLGTAPFALNALASSGLPVSLAASGNCTISGNILTVISAGSCTVTASQAGNADFLPATSVVQQFSIYGVSSQVTLTPRPNPVTFGARVTLTATVTPPGGTGKVTFYDGATILGIQVVSNGQATLPARLTSTGHRSLRARYSGDSSYPGSTSSSVTVTVNATPASGFGPLYSIHDPPPDSIIATGVDADTADFNGDGIADLVFIRNLGPVAGPPVGAIRVVLGNGDGTFTQVVDSDLGGTFPLGSKVVVGDFNGDGRPDLAIAVPGAQQVSIWVGKGDGSFAASIGAAIAGAFTITVANNPGAAATSGTVTVSEDTLFSIGSYIGASRAGAGWNCSGSDYSCSRSDPLPGGASYPPITVTVALPSNSLLPFVNSVTVSGGNSPLTEAFDTVMLFLSSGPVSTIQAVENAASFQVKDATHGAAPNSLVSIYATNLGTTSSTGSLFPATYFQGVEVLFNGSAVPLYNVIPSANLINVTVPSELPATGTATVTVVNSYGLSQNFTLTLQPDDVGLFRLSADPAHPSSGAVTFAGTAWLVMSASTAAVYHLGPCSGVPFDISCGQPAKPGDNIVIYFTGGGLATQNGEPSGEFVQTGTAAPPDGSILYRTVQTPTVTIGGVRAPVQFSGIAPGTASEYQLNTVVPAGVLPGDSVPLTVSFGHSSDTVTIAVGPAS